MAKHVVVLPRLGEAVIEATLTKWLKNEGDPVQEEEPIAEIATDKVDTEINSPVTGVLFRKLVAEGDVIPVGKAIAEIEGEGVEIPVPPAPAPEAKKPAPAPVAEAAPQTGSTRKEFADTRFYSPLVKNIAREENIPFEELDRIPGTGLNDRLTKQDVMDYLGRRKSVPKSLPETVVKPASDDQIVEMDRIRQLISAHMVRSVQTSPHVTSFMEADMTRIVQWREQHKEDFLKREGFKLTFTPFFIEAIARAVRDFPRINVSVDGNRILVHRYINVGMAVALPDSNLIVPVIRNADQKSLLGIARDVNDLAIRARNAKLLPDDIAGGTISLTNLGSFGTLMGTPIINQPQVAIVAAGAIKKRPVVVETPEGDVIAVRHMMIVSVTYDHRVVDGALAGRFLEKLISIFENFDTTQTL